MENTQHSSNTLSRSERLRGRGAVSRLFAEGASGFVYPLRYLWIEREGKGEAQASVLFTVPKRFHKRANRRNLLRRRIKEAYRLHKTLLEGAEEGLDIALIYTTKEILEYGKIERAVTKILQTISDERRG